ncbi:MAG: pentapeptide repeat-containing protein [Cyanobacteria bacterium P01_H01_bin.58]
MGKKVANEEHLNQLKQGVESWNRWRLDNSLITPDLRDSDLSHARLSRANLSHSSLSGVNLSAADLRDSDLRGADLRSADFGGADMCFAQLKGANLSEAYLDGAKLDRANLSEANLDGVYLNGASLKEAKMSKVNLRGAFLREAQCVSTNFGQSIFTGACLENWNINSETRFDGAACDYVYLKINQQERRPREGIFQPGEFAALFQQALDTIDLIFKDGIDWLVFFQSFEDLRSQYAAQDLSMQAIERKRGGAFVVRLEVAEGADKKAIEGRAKELYETQLKAFEAQYEKQLRLQGEQHLAEIQRLIAAERQEKATLMGVLTTMASNQGSKFDLRNAQFAGGFAETVQGNQIGGSVVDGAAEMPSLAEATAEIQNLLKQLEASNPAATEAEQRAYLSALIPPTRRERFIGALRAAGGAAIEEVPYGAVLKALVEGWQKPNG